MANRKPYIRPQFAAMAAVADELGLSRLAGNLRLFGKVNPANLQRERHFMGNGYATLHATLTGRALEQSAAISETARLAMVRAWKGSAA